MSRLSEAVKKRKQERRRRRFGVVYASITAILFVGSIAYQAYQAHRRIAMVNAPTWATFTSAYTATPFHERILGVNWDGVPTTLIINGEQWTVVQVDHFDDAEKYKAGERFGGVQGQTFCENKTIAYIPAENRALLKVNLMHEVFHAGDCLHGGDTWWNSEKPTDENHPGIYHLGEFMSAFAHDNPTFMEWQADRN